MILDTERMIKELRYEAVKHKDDKLFTGQTNISAMCADAADRLEELYKDLEETRFELHEYKSLYFTPQRIRIIDREYLALIKGLSN